MALTGYGDYGDDYGDGSGDGSGYYGYGSGDGGGSGYAYPSGLGARAGGSFDN